MSPGATRGTDVIGTHRLRTQYGGPLPGIISVSLYLIGICSCAFLFGFDCLYVLPGAKAHSAAMILNTAKGCAIGHSSTKIGIHWILSKYHITHIDCHGPQC